MRGEMGKGKKRFWWQFHLVETWIEPVMVVSPLFLLCALARLKIGLQH